MFVRECSSEKCYWISPPKMLPECLRNALRESKFPKFSGVACPQTLLGGLWAYAHSITIVTVYNQRSEPPPHFYYLFSALAVENGNMSLLIPASHSP